MISRILRIIPAVLVFVSFAVRAEEPKKCSASAHECEQEIRRMLAGRRYLGLQVVELPHGGILVKSVNDDGHQGWPGSGYDDSGVKLDQPYAGRAAGARFDHADRQGEWPRRGLSEGRRRAFPHGSGRSAAAQGGGRRAGSVGLGRWALCQRGPAGGRVL